MMQKALPRIEATLLASSFRWSIDVGHLPAEVIPSPRLSPTVARAASAMLRSSIRPWKSTNQSDSFDTARSTRLV